MIERVIKLLRKPVNINVIISIMGMLYAFIVYKMRFTIKVSVLILVLSIFLIITARTVYSPEDKRKILLYRIIMGMCYV
ncbi:MAG: hypothetical protein IJN85_01390, partial [Oscillospiraceae bacterium]|nr:hypothetical protein [Oscillospiraceae bacterium]